MITTDKIAQRIADDLAIIISEAEKHGTLPLLKSVAIYFDDVELRTIIKALSASVAGEANPIAWRWKIRLNQAWCYDDRKPYSYPDAQPLYAAPSPALEPTAWYPIENKPPWQTCEERGIYTHNGDGLFYFKATHWRPALASPAPGNADHEVSK